MPITWNYVQDHPYKGDNITADRRMYLRLYPSPERALEDEKSFNNRLVNWQEKLESGQRHPDHEKQYAKYFKLKSTSVRGTKVRAKEEALAEVKRNYGYFVLLSNEINNSVETLVIYRYKDQVEKAFDNLKERLNLRRMAVTSEQSLDGKLFVQFVALIFYPPSQRKGWRTTCSRITQCRIFWMNSTLLNALKRQVRSCTLAKRRNAR